MGRPFATGRINYTLEAQQQLRNPGVEYVDAFPLVGRARCGVRLGMRTNTIKKKTLVAYEID